MRFHPRDHDNPRATDRRLPEGLTPGTLLLTEQDCCLDVSDEHIRLAPIEPFNRRLNHGNAARHTMDSPEKDIRQEITG
jgi:hypothetical protein